MTKISKYRRSPPRELSDIKLLLQQLDRAPQEQEHWRSSARTGPLSDPDQRMVSRLGLQLQRELPKTAPLAGRRRRWPLVVFGAVAASTVAAGASWYIPRMGTPDLGLLRTASSAQAIAPQLKEPGTEPVEMERRPASTLKVVAADIVPSVTRPAPRNVVVQPGQDPPRATDAGRPPSHRFVAPDTTREAPDASAVTTSQFANIDRQQRADAKRALAVPETAAPPPAPAAKKVEPPKLDRSQRAALLAKGRQAMANGNIGSARLWFAPAAEDGDPDAAMMLATTYDPIKLARLAVVGMAGDRDAAIRWYKRAAELGAENAQASLSALGVR